MATNEGRVIGEATDKKFHDALLGKDELPLGLIERLKAEAIARGMNPADFQVMKLT